jgi:hypothetical protein
MRGYERYGWFQQLRSLREAMKADLLFLPCKLADHFAATIKALQD